MHHTGLLKFERPKRKRGGERTEFDLIGLGKFHQ